jgi:hypothetical protein
MSDSSIVDKKKKKKEKKESRRTIIRICSMLKAVTRSGTDKRLATKTGIPTS